MEEEPAPVKSNPWLVFGAAAVLLMILIGLVVVPSYMRKQKLENDKYNNFPFFQDEDGFWYTIVEKQGQPYQIPFYYHPSELEGIAVEPNLRDKFFDIRDRKGEIFISVDPNSDSNKVVIAGVEIAKITGDRYGLLNVSTRSAFTRPVINSTFDSPTPIVTCQHADNDTMVVGFLLSNKNLAYSRGNCVVIEASDAESFVKVADRLAYHILGILI